MAWALLTWGLLFFFRLGLERIFSWVSSWLIYRMLVNFLFLKEEIHRLCHIKRIPFFPSQGALVLESASRKFLFFISVNLMYLAIKLMVFRWKQIHFVIYFDKNMFLSDFKICFYDKNTLLMIGGKCKIIPVSKISIWPYRENNR